MKTVEDIAKIWKKKSAESIFPGVDSPLANFRGKRSIKNFKQSTAFKTGNLLRQFVKENANNSFTKIKLKNGESYELVLRIAPKGAFYGKFVHNGTVKNGTVKMGGRPFVEIGGDSKEVQDTVKEFLDSLPISELDKQKEKLRGTLSRLVK